MFAKVVVISKLSFSCLAFLGRDQDNPISCTGAVDSSRGRIFQHRYAFYIIRIDIVHGGDHTVYHHHGTGVVDRADTSYPNRSRITAGLPGASRCNGDSSHCSLQRVPHTTHRTVGKFFWPNCRYGAGKVFFALLAKSDDNHFLKIRLVRLHGDIDRMFSTGCYLLRFIAYITKDKNTIVRYFQLKFSICIGRCSNSSIPF
ncbi:hypothetical protein D3C87_639520 [compost metagenome]